VTGRRGRRRRKLLNDLQEMRGYSHSKKAVDRTMWRVGFGRSFGPVVRQTAKRMNGYTRYEKHFLPTMYGPDTHCFQDRLSVKSCLP
jgi:hypothetical protein